MSATLSSWFDEAHGLTAGPVTSIKERDAVRRMQARIYAERGATYEIGPDGTVADEWVEISDYIAVWGPNREPLGTLRLIPMTERSLPTLNYRELDPHERQWIDLLPHRQLGEIASMAIDARGFAPLQISAHLYRAMFQFASQDSCRSIWLASINLLLLRFMTGCMRFPLEVAGPSSTVANMVSQPAIADLHRYVREAPFQSPRTWRYMTRGMVQHRPDDLMIAGL